MSYLCSLCLACVSMLAIKCYVPWTLLAHSLCALDVLMLTLHPSTTKYSPWFTCCFKFNSAAFSLSFLTTLVQVDLWIPIGPFLSFMVFLFKFTYNEIHLFVVQFCEFWQMHRVVELLSYSRYRTPLFKNLSLYYFVLLFKQFTEYTFYFYIYSLGS